MLLGDASLRPRNNLHPTSEAGGNMQNMQNMQKTIVKAQAGLIHRAEVIWDMGAE